MMALATIIYLLLSGLSGLILYRFLIRTDFPNALSWASGTSLVLSFILMRLDFTQWRRFTMEPDMLKIEGGGFFGGYHRILPKETLLYAYGEGDYLNNSEEGKHLAIGYVGQSGPLRWPDNDAQDRALIAHLIRDYYQIPEFPVSERVSPDPPTCLACRYDLRGTLSAGRVACPECGKDAASWQIEEYTRQESMWDHGQGRR